MNEQNYIIQPIPMPEFRKLIEAVNESVRENSRLLREAAEREERARAERIAQWEKERKEREEAEKRREEAEKRREAKREAEREKERKKREEAEKKREEAEKKREEAEKKREAKREAEREKERKEREEAEKRREEAENRREAKREAEREKERKEREEAEKKREAEREKERKEREEAEKKREAEREKERKEREEAEKKREAEREKERKEAERIMRKSDTRIDRMVDMFTTQWGKLVEALCKPAALKLFKKSGIGINQIYKECAHGKDPISGEDRVEIDVLYENNHVMVATEVKTTCSKSDVDEFIAKMENFKTYFKVFADKTVYGAMAAIKYTQSADKYAQKKGLFVLTFSGEDTFTMSEPGTRKMF